MFGIIYINDLLISSNKSFEDYRSNRDKVQKNLKQKRFKANIENYFSDGNELENLGFRITRQGIMRLPDKVEAINNIEVPTTNK